MEASKEEPESTELSPSCCSPHLDQHIPGLCFFYRFFIEVAIFCLLFIGSLIASTILVIKYSRYFILVALVPLGFLSCIVVRDQCCKTKTPCRSKWYLPVYTREVQSGGKEEFHIDTSKKVELE
jgi:hypothetical protein